MSLMMTISGLDDSASLLPTVEPLIYGFPSTDLYALYLYEDGAIGSNPSQATDSSGNAHHAPMVANSAVTRTAEGVKTGDAANLGFLANTGYSAAADFTIFGVARNRLPASLAGQFPTEFVVQRNGPTAGLSASVATLNIAERGLLSVNHDNVSADSGGTAGAEIGLLNYTTASAGWAGGSSRRVARNTAAAKASWIAWALSVNHTTGVVLFKAMGVATSITALSDLTAWSATVSSNGPGNVLLGMAHYGAQTAGALGDVGADGIYSSASDEAKLDKIIAALKTKMGTRGVSSVL